MKTLKMLLLVIFVFASSLRAQSRPRSAVLDDWALTAQNAVREGAIKSITTWQSTTLYIAMAVASNTTAHTDGTVFHIQISPADSGDEIWHEQASYTMGKGITGSNTTLDITPNAASKTIRVNISAAGKLGRFDDDGIRFIFVQGSVVTNSEICTLVSHATGAATSVTILDPLTNSIGASTTIWDWAETYIYELPKQANRVRVIHDNTYDPDGAPIYTYCAIFGQQP